jgi:hypothetical protein
MREFKAQLLARETAQQIEMARRWLKTEEELEGKIEALAQQLADMREAGETVASWRVYELDRYRSLLAQGREEFRSYAGYAAGRIEQGQEEFGAVGLENATEAITASYSPYGVGAMFNRLPLSAIENMVGLSAGGAPLGELLRERMVGSSIDVWQRLTQTLVDSTALGRNPRVTARLMRDDLSGGLDKALEIARTEQLRVYRSASSQQYQASGVVQKQKRLCDHSGRVCAACLADEGRGYPLDAPISDHPRGRCTGVPVVVGLPEVQWTQGEDWLQTQDEETQRQILGPQRYELWQNGQLDFGAIATHTYDDTWGWGLGVTPLRELEPTG